MSNRTDTPVPYPTHFRSPLAGEPKRYPLRKTGPVIMSEVYPLQDRIALVTGASSGLGRHFGLLLAANGAHVALAARSIDRVADTAKAITAQGGKALAVAIDETGKASCRERVCQYV